MNLRLPIQTMLCATVILVGVGVGNAQDSPSGVVQDPSVQLVQDRRSDRQPVNTPPDRLLADAIAELESHGSISAKIRHQVDMFGRQLAGSGSYLELAPGRESRLRMELQIQLGHEPTTLLRVRDGKYLWTYRKLIGVGTLTRIDLQRVQRALEESGEMGNVDGVSNWPTMGGLSKLLRSLQESFEFTDTSARQLGPLDVWELHGQWKPEKLARFLPDQKEAIEAGEKADTTRLPPHVPDQVVLHLGRGDRFPYRIEYRRTDPSAQENPAGAVRTLVSMELYEVKIDAPIDPGQFAYTPGNLGFSDDTDRFLESLGLEP